MYTHILSIRAIKKINWVLEELNKRIWKQTVEVHDYGE